MEDNKNQKKDEQENKNAEQVKDTKENETKNPGRADHLVDKMHNITERVSGTGTKPFIMGSDLDGQVG